MSSLAAARADNFYFPPDWRPEYGSISKYQGSKGANQYEQSGIIRFEMPFDGWCLQCKRHVSKGTRFNAKKEQDGKYLSTKIWSFHTKCASCDQKFIIRTNPKDRTYDFVEGLRQMEQEFTPDFDDSIILATTDEQRLLFASNPIARLEHDGEDRKKVLTINERLTAISDIKDEQFLDDYTSNAKLRTSLRTKKHEDQSLLREGNRYGFNIPLVEKNSIDDIQAKLAIQRRVMKTKDTNNNNEHGLDIRKIKEIQNASIFSATSNSVRKRTRTSSSNDDLIYSFGEKAGTSSSSRRSHRKISVAESDALSQLQHRNSKLSTKQHMEAYTSSSSSSMTAVGADARTSHTHSVKMKKKRVTQQVSVDVNRSNSHHHHHHQSPLPHHKQQKTEISHSKSSHSCPVDTASESNPLSSLLSGYSSD